MIGFKNVQGVPEVTTSKFEDSNRNSPTDRKNVQHDDIHHFIEPRYCLAHTQISQHRRHCLDAEHEHVNVEDL